MTINYDMPVVMVLIPPREGAFASRNATMYRPKDSPSDPIVWIYSNGTMHFSACLPTSTAHNDSIYSKMNREDEMMIQLLDMSANLLSPVP